MGMSNNYHELGNQEMLFTFESNMKCIYTYIFQECSEKVKICLYSFRKRKTLISKFGAGCLWLKIIHLTVQSYDGAKKKLTYDKSWPLSPLQYPHPPVIKILACMDNGCSTCATPVTFPVGFQKAKSMGNLLNIHGKKGCKHECELFNNHIT